MAEKTHYALPAGLATRQPIPLLYTPMESLAVELTKLESNLSELEQKLDKLTAYAGLPPTNGDRP